MPNGVNFKDISKILMLSLDNVRAENTELVEALEAMCKEFRELDLPYGSEAYCKANSVINKVRGEKK